MIDWSRLDTTPLAAQFAAAMPFRHVVIDGLLSTDDHERVSQDFGREPHYELDDEIYVQLRSQEPPQTPALGALYASLTGEPARAAVGAIFGAPLAHADGAAYVYAPGHYLLPHSDSRFGRAVAYAYYVKACARGGELELFACTQRDGEIVETRSAKRIEAVPNRLVLFEVTPLALHQVCEVLEGTRQSLAGWYFAADAR